MSLNRPVTRDPGHLPGIAFAPPRVSIAGGATDATLFLLPASRKVRVSKLWISNQGAGAALFTVGYTVTAGAVWTPVMPDVNLAAGAQRNFEEWELPQFRFTLALGAPAIVIRSSVVQAGQWAQCEVKLA